MIYLQEVIAEDFCFLRSVGEKGQQRVHRLDRRDNDSANAGELPHSLQSEWHIKAVLKDQFEDQPEYLNNCQSLTWASVGIF